MPVMLQTQYHAVGTRGDTQMKMPITKVTHKLTAFKSNPSSK